MTTNSNAPSSAPSSQNYDVVIVGSGISGALMAKQLGLAGHKVLILEAGAALPPNINDYMERFFKSPAKVPESPYTPDLFADPDTFTLNNPSELNAPRPTVLTLSANNWQDPKQAYLIQKGPLAFGSTYERINGGTVRHWLGTSLRLLPNDFQMEKTYHVERNWPISYDDLSDWYGAAEYEIGVSANVDDQDYLGITFPEGYNYPMPALPNSLVDQYVASAVNGAEVDGAALEVTVTPAGRNSRPYQDRPACGGNTNCIPICPIRAKYDPSVTLNDALQTGNVTIQYQTVATEVLVGDNDEVTGIQWTNYDGPSGGVVGTGIAKARFYILATHAIETPKLLLMSKNGGKTPNGVANNSDQVGRNLMDHPLYLAWGLASKPVYPYRGPLSTSGIETLRDGSFRTKRAAFRIEIGNEGWNFPFGDPYKSLLDAVANPKDQNVWHAGQSLVDALNDRYVRQFRMAFLVEQTADPENRVTLSETETDHLGLPRPEIHYAFSDYTKAGFEAAREVADQLFALMGAKQKTDIQPKRSPTTFDYNGKSYEYFGAGHIVGTCRMGSGPKDSVVNADLKTWDHDNLYILGSSVFPTVATANPTLTIAALTLKSASSLIKRLAG
ncbi:GMC family oxidoreductase [Rhizobium sp.]|jgi:glucose dehydrogenase|uniref:GMC family oxidoreductase n=1 Tax=Rhizobium sp. TaxID=391 RepID=UPI000E99AB60|nr:GMC family oxidoreductase [Rhizobium sp.]